MSKTTFTPIGGGSEIGANSFLFTADGCRILLDCGMHPKKEGVEALPDLSLLRQAPDAVVVTHGHIDHCGAVPYLLTHFPSAIPYATAPTVRIMDRMLHNSVAVMGMLALEQGVEGYPLYSHDDVDYALGRTYGLDLEREFVPVLDKPVRASFHHAGHVLGSASVLLRAPGHVLFYTGDICTTDQELMAGLTPLDPDVQVDTLVIESTYGANEEADAIRPEVESARFAGEITRVLRRGGVALIPAFALGRTQEQLNLIARLQSTGEIPDVPVYASGLGRAIYEIYCKHTGYLRPGAIPRPLRDFKRIGDVWEHQVVLDLLRKPCIIVATAGMMIENTPSAMIAMEMVRHKKHGIFFVGYLDPDTLGYHLLHAEPGDAFRFETSGRRVPIELQNIQQFHFSAHATRSALTHIVERIRPKNVVFIHGDPEAVAWMQEHGGAGSRAFAPGLGETVLLER